MVEIKSDLDRETYTYKHYSGLFKWDEIKWVGLVIIIQIQSVLSIRHPSSRTSKCEQPHKHILCKNRQRLMMKTGEHRAAAQLQSGTNRSRSHFVPADIVSVMKTRRFSFAVSHQLVWHVGLGTQTEHSLSRSKNMPLLRVCTHLPASVNLTHSKRQYLFYYGKKKWHAHFHVTHSRSNQRKVYTALVSHRQSTRW